MVKLPNDERVVAVALGNEALFSLSFKKVVYTVHCTLYTWPISNMFFGDLVEVKKFIIRKFTAVYTKVIESNQAI
jgi:hypothetical protein